LSDHVFCREFEDGAILLDLRTGNYLGLHAEILPRLKTHIANWPDPVDAGLHGVKTAAHDDVEAADAVVADLLSRGVLTPMAPSATHVQAAGALTSLAVTCRLAAAQALPIGHVLKFVQALIHVKLSWRGGKLEPMLGWLSMRQGTLADVIPPDPNTLLPFLRSYCRLRVWFYTARDHCLFDSLVLSAFLTKCNLPCTFVIGIATKPFVAHAWVQSGDAVLNDTAEYIQTFDPILAIGAAAG
jgi:hypothetical protein